MANVGIVTDTIACLPQEIIKKYNIGIVPVALNINGKPFLDQVDITSDEFWKIFPDVKEFTTGAPPIGKYVDVYREASKYTNNIVCTFVSKNLSAIFETAIQARDIFIKENPGINIEIIDSMTAAGAQEFIVLAMARAAQAGKTLNEVIEAGNDMIRRAKFLCGMETLKYLIKSGRAPKTAYMGELFQVKPIIGMVSNTGVVENLGRARGKKACMEKMVDMISEYIGTTKPLHVITHYTNNIEDGKKLKELVTAKYQCDVDDITPYTPVMSGHTGPVSAISFYV